MEDIIKLGDRLKIPKEMIDTFKETKSIEKLKEWNKAIQAYQDLIRKQI